jgi:hypothetical protein
MLAHSPHTTHNTLRIGSSLPARLKTPQVPALQAFLVLFCYGFDSYKRMTGVR